MKILSTEIEYFVSLIDGRIRVGFHEDDKKPGEAKYCTLNRADFQSLNVLRQNVNEEKFKTGKLPKTISRTVFDTTIIHYVEELIEKMNYIRETFPEHFI